MNKKILGLLPVAIAALFIAFTTTIQFPMEIYWNNIEEFSITPDTLVPVFSIAFITVFLTFFLSGLIPYSYFRERYFSFIATLGLLLWFTANFMFGNYGAFDERGLVIDTNTLRAIAEISIWIVLLTASVIFSPKIKKIQFQAVSGLLLISILLTTYHATLHYINAPTLPPESKEVLSKEYLQFSTQRNVIHIVLDEMQTTITEKLLEENPGYSAQLDGFIFYPNTVSVYPSTVMSVPVMLSGKIYRNDMDKQQFTTDVFANNAFMQTLENANYQINTHTLPRFCNQHKLKNCSPIPPKPANNTSLTLLDYSFFKTVPDVLKPKIYRKGRWWLSDRFVIQDHSAIEPGVGHLVFTDFNENMVARDIQPTYKFYHTFISHAPTLLDAECNILIQRASTKSFVDRKNQGACAYKHVFAFIDKLKSLGIYDNTMIIISSDHGSVYTSDALEQDLIARNIDPEHYSTGLATLMIKPFNAHGPLKISLAPASLADIPNTIVATLGLNPLENGVNVLELSDESERVREYLFYNWANEYWATVTLPPLTVYSINGDVRNPADWSYKETLEEKKTFP